MWLNCGQFRIYGSSSSRDLTMLPATQQNWYKDRAASDVSSSLLVQTWPTATYLHHVLSGRPPLAAYELDALPMSNSPVADPPCLYIACDKACCWPAARPPSDPVSDTVADVRRFLRCLPGEEYVERDGSDASSGQLPVPRWPGIAPFCAPSQPIDKTEAKAKVAEAMTDTETEAGPDPPGEPEPVPEPDEPESVEHETAAAVHGRYDSWDRGLWVLQLRRDHTPYYPGFQDWYRQFYASLLHMRAITTRPLTARQWRQCMQSGSKANQGASAALPVADAAPVPAHAGAGSTNASRLMAAAARFDRAEPTVLPDSNSSSQSHQSRPGPQRIGGGYMLHNISKSLRRAMSRKRKPARQKRTARGAKDGTAKLSYVRTVVPVLTLPLLMNHRHRSHLPTPRAHQPP